MRTPDGGLEAVEVEVEAGGRPYSLRTVWYAASTWDFMSFLSHSVTVSVTTSRSWSLYRPPT